MDKFFEDMTLPSTSHSSPKTGHEDSQIKEDTDHDSSLGKTMTEFQEQHTSTCIDYISRRVQKLVENINSSRASDQKMMDSFQGKLIEKVTEACQQMKEQMFTLFEENSNKMEMRLQELSEVLERCTKLNSELLDASQALLNLRQGLTASQTSEST